MKIKGLLSDEKNPKISSYLCEDNNYIFLVDAGSSEIEIATIKKIKAIFLTHAHYDHTVAIFKKEFLDNLEPDVKIYSTKTTKRLLKVFLKYQQEYSIIKQRHSNTLQKKIDQLLENIIEVYYDQKISINHNQQVTFFKAGHMFGAAMVYYDNLRDKVLFTGDIDFAWISEKESKIDLYRSYDQRIFDKIKPTMLIVDGTTISQSFQTDGMDYKHDVVTRIVTKITSSSYKRPYKLITRYDKAIPIAKRLAKDARLKDYKIVYGAEFLETNRVLYEAGYEIYHPGKLYQYFGTLGRVMKEQFENQNYILIEQNDSNIKGSSNSAISLHIAFGDLEYFLNRFVNCRKIISHYNLNEKIKYQQYCKNRRIELLLQEQEIEL